MFPTSSITLYQREDPVSNCTGSKNHSTDFVIVRQKKRVVINKCDGSSKKYMYAGHVKDAARVVYIWNSKDEMTFIYYWDALEQSNLF